MVMKFIRDSSLISIESKIYIYTVYPRQYCVVRVLAVAGILVRVGVDCVRGGGGEK